MNVASLNLYAYVTPTFQIDIIGHFGAPVLNNMFYEYQVNYNGIITNPASFLSDACPGSVIDYTVLQNEILTEVERIRSLKNECNDPCYLVYYNKRPLTYDGLKILGNDQQAMVYIAGHSKYISKDEYEIDPRIYDPQTQQRVTINSRKLSNKNFNFYGCHLSNKIGGEIKVSAALEKLRDDLKKIKKCKNTTSRLPQVIYVSGTHDGLPLPKDYVYHLQQKLNEDFRVKPPSFK